MILETGVQSLVASYQRLLKWYFILPCLTRSNIRYVSRVKWSNPRKGVAPSPTTRCRKGSLLVALDYGRQLYLHIHHPMVINLELLLRNPDADIFTSLQDMDNHSFLHYRSSVNVNHPNWIMVSFYFQHGLRTKMSSF